MTRSPGWRSASCRPTTGSTRSAGRSTCRLGSSATHAVLQRAEGGVFGCRRLGDRAVVMTMELDRSAQEDRSTTRRRTAGESGRDRASVKRVLRGRRAAAAGSPDTSRICAASMASTRESASQYKAGRVLLVGRCRARALPYWRAGLNLGLQDAVNLGWKLPPSSPAALSPHCSRTDRSEAPAERVIMHSRPSCLFRPRRGSHCAARTFLRTARRSRNRRPPQRFVSGADNRTQVGPMRIRSRTVVPDFSVADGGVARRVAELARSGRTTAD